MTYIWESLLRADEQDFPREKIRFTQSKTISPLMEVAFEELNRQQLDEAPIEVNANYRFGAIFGGLIDTREETANFRDYPEFRECLYDILMHYLAQLNIREGLCKNEYQGLFLRRNVQNKLSSGAIYLVGL